MIGYRSKEEEMYYYRIYGLAVKSDFELWGMNSIPTQEVSENSEWIDLHAGELEGLLEEIQSVRENSTLEDGTMPSTIYRLSMKQSVFFVDKIGIFRISGGNRIEYLSILSKEDILFQHWILNLAFGLLFIQRNEVALHGACLMMPDSEDTFVISGESGSGKSTLSNALLQRGCRFMSDDVVPLLFEETVKAVASYPQRRLCVDVVEREHIDTNKLRYFVDGNKQKYTMDMSDAYYDKNQTLKALFLIKTVSEEQEVSVREVTGGEKLNTMISSIYKKESYKEIGINQTIFQKCLQAAKYLHIYELRRPEGKMTVMELTEMVMMMMRRERK